jgi:hypothetical protein
MSSLKNALARAKTREAIAPFLDQLEKFSDLPGDQRREVVENLKANGEATWATDIMAQLDKDLWLEEAEQSRKENDDE